MTTPMFCRQCEQAADSRACTLHGLCGKSAPQSVLMDLCAALTLNLGKFAYYARLQNFKLNAVNRLTAEAFASTQSNTLYSESALSVLIMRLVFARDGLARDTREHFLSRPDVPLDIGGMIELGHKIGCENSSVCCSTPIAALRETLIAGLKGLCAYAVASFRLGRSDDAVFEFIHRAMARLDELTLGQKELLALCMECGKITLLQLSTLSDAHEQSFGATVSRPLPIVPRPGKCILAAGSDLLALEGLLMQAEANNVDVYTYGDMRSAYLYKRFTQFKNLVGHYGHAWHEQRAAFSAFPGAILVTSEDVMLPAAGYEKRFFTMGLCRINGITHVRNGDFEPVIQCALKQPGFTQENCTAYPAPDPMMMAPRNDIAASVTQLAEDFRKGVLRHLVFFGGSDGANDARRHFGSELKHYGAESVIYTWGSARFRLDGLFSSRRSDQKPQIFDAGASGDVFSIVRLLMGLKRELHCDWHSLPVVFYFSWHEQKSIAVFLALLSLGVRNIQFGPSYPPFWTLELCAYMEDKFNLQRVFEPQSTHAEIVK